MLVPYRRLSRINRGPLEQFNQVWETAHRAFHRSLIEACGSRWLITFCEQLFDLADRYRLIARSAPEAQVRLHPDEHRAIMEATIARDVDLAVHLGNAHITRTAELCRGKLRGRAPVPGGRAAG